MAKEAAEEAGEMSDVPEMVKRVARAIGKAGGSDPDFTGYQSGPADDARPSWLRQAKIARAAIEAMREPTVAMADAGRWPGEDGEPMEAWRAMVDAALTDTQPKGSETP